MHGGQRYIVELQGSGGASEGEKKTSGAWTCSKKEGRNEAKVILDKRNNTTEDQKMRQCSGNYTTEN